MKKIILRVSGLIACFALAITAMNVNAACIFIIHQPKMPENSLRLRKF